MPRRISWMSFQSPEVDLKLAPGTSEMVDTKNVRNHQKSENTGGFSGQLVVDLELLPVTSEMVDTKIERNHQKSENTG